MKKIFITMITVFMVALVPLAALTVETDTENSSVGPFTRTIEDDYLSAGDILSFDGSAEDVYMFGRIIDFSGDSSESVLLISESNSFSGNIRNNLIATGNDVSISGNVEDTTFFAGSEMTLEESGLIGGDLFGAGGSIDLDGTVKGDVKIAAGFLTITGTIEGDLVFEGSRLVIGENGRINGNLTYSTDRQISADESSRVGGSVEFDPDGFYDYKGYSNDFNSGSLFLWKLFFRLFFAVSLLVAGMLLLLIPGTERAFSLNNKKTFWNQTLLGIVPVLCYPIATVLAFIILPIGIAMSLAAFPLVIIALILGSTAVGGYIMSLSKKENSSRFVNFLIGIGIYFVLGFIPVLNFFVGAIFLAAGSGVVLSKIIEISKKAKKDDSYETKEVVTE